MVFETRRLMKRAARVDGGKDQGHPRLLVVRGGKGLLGSLHSRVAGGPRAPGAARVRPHFGRMWASALRGQWSPAQRV